MIKKIKGLFKKKVETNDEGEYLDFSDYTDVKIGGSPKVDPEALKNKPSKKVENLLTNRTLIWYWRVVLMMTCKL